MNKNAILSMLVVAVVVGGGAFWGGMSYAKGQATSARAGFAGGGTSFAGRAGRGPGGAAGAGGATFGTILSTSNGSMTIQLPSSTSSTATTGTKIVLFDGSTQIEEMQSVPASNLAKGQTVTITGTANSDGSVTAQTIQIRPTGPRGAPAGEQQ